MIFNSDSDDILSLWRGVHFYEMDVPEEVYDEDTPDVLAHPNSAFKASLIFYTLTPSELEALPTPTWRADRVSQSGQRTTFVSYSLLSPPSTEEVHRADKEKITRSKKLNLAYQVEYNLATRAGIKNGWNVSRVPNPYQIDSEWIFSWSGETYLLYDLRRTLKEAGIWVTSSHPKFMQEGGAASTPEQQMAREERARKGTAAARAKALQKDHEILRLLDEGMSTSGLAQRLGISEASVPVRVSRARKRVGEAPTSDPSPDRSEAEFDEEAERILSLLA